MAAENVLTMTIEEHRDMGFNEAAAHGRGKHPRRATG